MKIIILAVLSLMIPVTLFADTPSRVDDGTAVIAYGVVGSTTAWSQTEYDRMVADCVGSCSTQVYVKSKFEVWLSTTFKFNNYSGWVAAKKMSGEDLDFAKQEITKKERLKNFKREKNP